MPAQRHDFYEIAISTLRCYFFWKYNWNEN